MGFLDNVGKAINVICKVIADASNRKFADYAESLSRKSSYELEELIQTAVGNQKIAIILAIAKNGDIQNAIMLAKENSLYKSTFESYAKMEGAIGKQAKLIASEWNEYS